MKARPMFADRPKEMKSRPMLYGVELGSPLEADRFMILMSQQQDGAISGLVAQVALELAAPYTDASGKKWTAVRYTPDFAYMENGVQVSEEVKPANEKAPSAARRDWSVRMAWAARQYPEAVFRVWKG